MKVSNFSSIEARLSQRDPSYHEKIKTTDRRRYDWSLCESGMLSEAELLEIYLAATQLATIEEEELPEPVAVPYLSAEYLTANCCLGLEEENNVLKLLVCDPYSINRHRYFIETLHGKEVHFYLIRRSLLERQIAKLHAAQDRNSNSDGAFSDTQNEEMLKSLASEAKIVRLVNEIFSRAVEQRASDIHIEPRETDLAVRFRIDGVLHTYLSSPLSQYPAVASRIKLIGGLNIAERRLPQDGRTNFILGGKELDIRISTIPTICGESIVLRILRKDSLAFDLKQVGMLENIQKKFEKLIKLPHGMVLVVGPTGSGKTTTLYSVIDKLNDGKRKIITIEDPVEYKFPGISQMQANADIGLTFASGLRHIVRQDPDIILVGEIRDRETAAIAINAALTGHLVFSTLHTNDSAGAVSRLLDMGVEGFLVSSSLAGVLSQRLVRTICKECEGSGINFNFTGNRCKNCSGTGFRGRTGIFELLLVDDDIRSAILRNAPSTEIAAIAVSKGMMPLNEYGMLKVKDGVTTAEEVLMATIDNE
jgi:type II secretory ATPase GspE/PulE/Tfp pilus assembly ATPase PilB-like protein